jgi:GNAT superfamily N-acetyltransferase
MTYTVRERAERIHRQAWTDQYAAAPPAFVAATGLKTVELADDVYQFLLPNFPCLQFNRVLGLGVPTTPTSALVDMALEIFAQAECQRFALSLTESEPAANFLARGLAPLDTRALLTRPVEKPCPIDSTLEIEIVEADPADPQTFGSILALGYQVPTSMGYWGAALVGRPGWKTYLACVDGQPVGCAAMFAQDDMAWCGLATTLLEYRGRGVHRALFTRRILDARALGCHHIVTEAVPGTTAYRNMRRVGFTEQGRRINYGKCN